MILMNYFFCKGGHFSNQLRGEIRHAGQSNTSFLIKRGNLCIRIYLAEAFFRGTQQCKYGHVGWLIGIFLHIQLLIFIIIEN